MPSLSVDTNVLASLADQMVVVADQLARVSVALVEDCPNEAIRVAEVQFDLEAVGQMLDTVRIGVEETGELPTAGIFMLSLGLVTGSFDPANPGFDTAPIYNADGFQISPPYDAPPGTFWALVADPNSTRPDQEHAGNYVLLAGNPPPGASLVGMVWQMTLGTAIELYHGIVDSFENAMNRTQIGSTDAPNPLGLPTGLVNAAADSAPLNNAILSVTGLGELFDGDLSAADLLAAAQLAGVITFWTGGGGAIGSMVNSLDEVEALSRGLFRTIAADGIDSIDEGLEDLLAYSTALGRPSWQGMTGSALEPYLSRQVDLAWYRYEGHISESTYIIATHLMGSFEHNRELVQFASVLERWPSDQIAQYIDYARTNPVFLASQGVSIIDIEDALPQLKRFGDNLSIYGGFESIVDSPELSTALGVTMRLNDDVIKDFVERGGTLMVGDASYASFPGAWQSISQAPRGHPTLTSHSQIPAAASGSRAVVGSVAEFRMPSHVAVHEMGHVVDYTSGYLSQSEEFAALYQQFEDTVALRAAQDDLTNQQLADLKYFRQPGAAGASEYFAEAYAAVLLNYQANMYRLTLGNEALEAQLIEYMSTFGTPSAIPYGLPVGGPS